MISEAYHPGDFSHARQKFVCVRTRGKRAHETNWKTTVLARVRVTRARHSHKKLKLMFSPFGRSVPSLKINLISCCLRLMLLPEHCFKPQTMMSSREWEAELKCSATGNPRDLFRILRRCSLKRSRSRLPVSPMYRQLHRRQEMQYTTFSDWQVKWSRMLCALFGPCRNV